MALALTGTWEQALLTTVAQVAAPENNNGYLGRTALQKILYFLQISGIPMRYRFEIYHYGPYCDKIYRDVELLLADGVLIDVSANPGKYSNYRPAEAAAELIQLHRSHLEPYLTLLTTVVKALLPFKPDHLEILATLDYLYRALRAGGGNGPWKERVIGRFMQVKKDKFGENDVVAAYDAMVRANLIAN